MNKRENLSLNEVFTGKMTGTKDFGLNTEITDLINVIQHDTKSVFKTCV